MPYFDFYASEHAGAPKVADGSVLTTQAVHDSWRWVVQTRCSTADARIFALNILARPGTTAVRAFSSKRRGSTLGRLAFAVTIPPATPALERKSSMKRYIVPAFFVVEADETDTASLTETLDGAAAEVCCAVNEEYFVRPGYLRLFLDEVNEAEEIPDGVSPSSYPLTDAGIELRSGNLERMRDLLAIERAYHSLPVHLRPRDPKAAR